MKDDEMSKKEDDKKVAFVISPMGDPGSEVRKRADAILKYVIEPPLIECSYKAVRADKISEPGIITSQIITHIMNDPLVVADLTGHNPNVFYELAVRHAIKKPVVQLIQKGERIPFDVSTTRTIQIDHQDLQSVDEAKQELVKQIQAVEKDPSKVDSPISIAVDLQLLKQSEDPQRKALVEMRAMMQQIYASTADIKGILEETIISSRRNLASEWGRFFQQEPARQPIIQLPQITKEEVDRVYRYLKKITDDYKKLEKEKEKQDTSKS
jgi:hypothetical protein